MQRLAARRLRDLFASSWTMGTLVEFHTAHKLTLMAHSIAAYQELGRLVAGAKRRSRALVAAPSWITSYRSRRWR